MILPGQNCNRNFFGVFGFHVVSLMTKKKSQAGKIILMVLWLIFKMAAAETYFQL
jgi:hypothetical protein